MAIIGSILAWARLEAEADLGSTEVAVVGEELDVARENELRPGRDLRAFDQLPFNGAPAESPLVVGGGESMKLLLPGGRMVGVRGGGGGISPYLPVVLGGGLELTAEETSAALTLDVSAEKLASDELTDSLS